MGSWKYRRVSTTPGWYYGTNGVYDFRDDVAVVLLNRDRSNRYIQDVTGSQGIIFNQYVGLKRYTFGYPAPDGRWPQYRYNGEDLIYAIARDTYDTTKPGTMWIRSTMTGGSSGGPWIISPNSRFFGYVNSVNSHKPYGGAQMSGPCFGNAELQLFNTWKAA
ncbi:MAG: hypothetical protein M5U19_01815 [Microthrixaceae bacterium]|nr:hypothetical protein [Microthrixaceae bacterium]